MESWVHKSFPASTQPLQQQVPYIQCSLIVTNGNCGFSATGKTVKDSGTVFYIYKTPSYEQKALLLCGLPIRQRPWDLPLYKPVASISQPATCWYNYAGNHCSLASTVCLGFTSPSNYTCKTQKGSLILWHPSPSILYAQAHGLKGDSSFSKWCMSDIENKNYQL